jgi:orotate phosphoribosyltransferase-like protein
MPVSVHLFERIRQLAREGLGYEDIAARLNISWREVRPFVIGDRYDNVSKVQSDLGPLGRGAQHPIRRDRDGV